MKVKVCGITNIEDALAAAEAGADYLGFINYPESPRNIALSTAGEIVKKIKVDFPSIQFVLVTVNADIEKLRQAITQCGFNILQLHGEETVAACTELKQCVEVWKAVIVEDASGVAKAEAYRAAADKILFDAGRGSGKQVRVTWLRGQKVDVLGGGLGLHTDIGELATIKAEIVDINSAIESLPGKKDHAKMKLTIQKYAQTHFH